MAKVFATTTCRSVSSHAEAHTRNASVSRQMVPAPKLPTCLVFFFFLAFPLLLFAVGNGVRLSCILPPGIRVEQRCRVFLCSVPAVAIFFWPNINHSHLFILDFQFSQKKTNAKPIAAAATRARQPEFVLQHSQTSLVGWCLVACIQTARTACDFRMYLLHRERRRGQKSSTSRGWSFYILIVLLQSHGVFRFLFHCLALSYYCSRWPVFREVC